MLVIPDLHAVTRQDCQALDPKLVGGDGLINNGFPHLLGNPGRLKHDDFAALGFAEIISQPVNEQMIARC